MTNRLNIETVHVPRDMAYTCHSEGVCCHVFETIPLDEHAEWSLERLNVGALNDAAGNGPSAAVAVTNPLPPPARKMARKGCGECTMLTADNLCAIHKVAGESAKPRVCQDFPWRYTETPGGVYVGLSFVCPSVRNNRGQQLTEQVDGLTTRYFTSGSVREAAATVALNGRLNLPWADYLALEAALLDVLRLQEVALSVRLKALCILPALLDQALTQEGEEFLIGELLDKLRDTGYAHLLRLAVKDVKGGARPRRMFLGMFTGFANTLHRKNAGRFVTVARVMNQYVRHALGVGMVELKPVEARLSHAELQSVSLPENGPAAEQIARYLEHCIFRKDLLLSADVNRRVRMLALNAALLPWYAAAVTKTTGQGVPKDADWDEALSQVERLYGFHSAFFKFFEQNRIFSDITDSFILKPTYPFILFG